MSTDTFILQGCLTSARSNFYIAHTTTTEPTNSTQAAPSLPDSAVCYVLPKIDYRREVFHAFNDSFVKKFELNAEPFLRDRGAKPAWHCLTVMKAIRMMLRMKLDPIDGGIRWTAQAGRFTEDDTAMVRHHEILAVCRKFKPTFTIDQLRRSLTVLKNFGLIWTCPGRPKSTSRFYKHGGAVMYLRVNTGRLLKVLEGKDLLTPVRLSSCQPVDAPLCASVLPALVVMSSIESSTVSSQCPGVESSDDQSSTSSESLDSRGNGSTVLQPAWCLEVAPSSSPILSNSQAVLSEAEVDIIRFMTTTSGLFASTATWAQDCSSTNELTVDQLNKLRRHMWSNGLTIKFLQDYADMVINVSASNSHKGVVPWWANCTVGFFLKNFISIRKHAQARRLEQVTHVQSLQDISVEAVQHDLYLGAMLQTGIDITRPSQDLSCLSSGLGFEQGSPGLNCAGQRALWSEQDAYKGIVAVLLADQLPTETLRHIVSKTRIDVIGWLKRNPVHAKYLMGVLNFRFWFNLSFMITDPIELEAAHMVSAVNAGHSHSRCLALLASIPAPKKASSASLAVPSTTAVVHAA